MPLDYQFLSNQLKSNILHKPNLIDAFITIHENSYIIKTCSEPKEQTLDFNHFAWLKCLNSAFDG